MSRSVPGRRPLYHPIPKLDRLLTDPRYGRAARRFADRHAAFAPAESQAAMLERAEELLRAGGSATRVEPVRESDAAPTTAALLS